MNAASPKSRSGSTAASASSCGPSIQYVCAALVEMCGSSCARLLVRRGALSSSPQKRSAVTSAGEDVRIVAAARDAVEEAQHRFARAASAGRLELRVCVVRDRQLGIELQRALRRRLGERVVLHAVVAVLAEEEVDAREPRPGRRVARVFIERAEVEIARDRPRLGRFALLSGAQVELVRARRRGNVAAHEPRFCSRVSGSSSDVDDSLRQQILQLEDVATSSPATTSTTARFRPALRRAASGRGSVRRREGACRSRRRRRRPRSRAVFRSTVGREAHAAIGERTISDPIAGQRRRDRLGHGVREEVGLGIGAKDAEGEDDAAA